MIINDGGKASLFIDEFQDQNDDEKGDYIKLVIWAEVIRHYVNDGTIMILSTNP